MVFQNRHSLIARLENGAILNLQVELVLELTHRMTPLVM